MAAGPNLSRSPKMTITAQNTLKNTPIPWNLPLCQKSNIEKYKRLRKFALLEKGKNEDRHVK